MVTTASVARVRSAIRWSVQHLSLVKNLRVRQNLHRLDRDGLPEIVDCLCDSLGVAALVERQRKLVPERRGPRKVPLDRVLVPSRLELAGDVSSASACAVGDKALFALSGGKVTAWVPSDFSPLWSVTAPGGVRRISWHQSVMLLTSSKEVFLWRLGAGLRADPSSLQSLGETAEPIVSSTMLGNSVIAAIGTLPGKLELIELAPGRPIRQLFSLDGIASTDLSGGVLATLDQDAQLNVWEVDSGRVLWGGSYPGATKARLVRDRSADETMAVVTENGRHTFATSKDPTRYVWTGPMTSVPTCAGGCTYFGSKGKLVRLGPGKEAIVAEVGSPWVVAVGRGQGLLHLIDNTGGMSSWSETQLFSSERPRGWVYTLADNAGGPWMIVNGKLGLQKQNQSDWDWRDLTDSRIVANWTRDGQLLVLDGAGQLHQVKPNQELVHTQLANTPVKAGSGFGDLLWLLDDQGCLRQYQLDNNGSNHVEVSATIGLKQLIRLAAAPGGLCSGSTADELHVFDTTGKLIRSHRTSSRCLSMLWLSPTSIVTGHEQGEVNRWEFETFTPTTIAKLNGPVRALYNAGRWGLVAQSEGGTAIIGSNGGVTMLRGGNLLCGAEHLVLWAKGARLYAADLRTKELIGHRSIAGQISAIVPQAAGALVADEWAECHRFSIPPRN